MKFVLFSYTDLNGSQNQEACVEGLNYERERMSLRLKDLSSQLLLNPFPHSNLYPSDVSSSDSSNKMFSSNPGFYFLFMNKYILFCYVHKESMSTSTVTSSINALTSFYICFSVFHFHCQMFAVALFQVSVSASRVSLTLESVIGARCSDVRSRAP